MLLLLDSVCKVKTAIACHNGRGRGREGRKKGGYKATYNLAELRVCHPDETGENGRSKRWGKVGAGGGEGTAHH